MTIKSKALGYILVTLSLWGCGEQQTITEIVTQAFDSNQLNGVVLVAEHGDVVFQRAHGHADGSLSGDITKGHRFQLGSIYKEFSGVAVMRLIEMGHVELKAPVSDYLKGYPSWAEDITVEQLFTYTSGLPEVPWGTLQDRYGDISEHNLKRALKADTKLVAAPGDKFIYSNYNPFLLIQIVEAVGKQPYAVYLEENLFAPIDIKHAVFPSRYPYLDKELMALPMTPTGEVDNVPYTLPNMSLALTAEDLMKWLQSLYMFKTLSQESLELLSQQQADRSPLGQMKWSENTISDHRHHGSSGNFEAAIRYIPERSRIIVILTNMKQGHVEDIIEKISTASAN